MHDDIDGQETNYDSRCCKLVQWKFDSPARRRLLVMSLATIVVQLTIVSALSCMFDTKLHTMLHVVVQCVFSGRLQACLGARPRTAWALLTRLCQAALFICHSHVLKPANMELAGCSINNVQ